MHLKAGQKLQHWVHKIESILTTSNAISSAPSGKDTENLYMTLIIVLYKVEGLEGH